MSKSKQQRRRAPWNPAIGAAVFAKASGRACAAANPTALTDEDVGFLMERVREGLAALWRNDITDMQLKDVLEALCVTQALVDAGAGAEHMETSRRAIQAGAEVREQHKSWSRSTSLASVAQIEAISEGLEVYEAILRAGLTGIELLQAMDIVTHRQRAGQVIRVGGRAA